MESRASNVLIEIPRRLTAIDKILSDDALAMQYAQAAHERVVENFTIPKMMEKMNEVYKELE